MSDPRLRPIWTPADYEQTRRDAARHRLDEYQAQAAHYAAGPFDVPRSRPPFARTEGRSCGCCGAWPFESCDPGCLSTMTPEQQQKHRDDVLDRTLVELDCAAPAFPESGSGFCSVCGRTYGDASRPGCQWCKGRHRTPTVVGMRPRRAAAVGRWLIAVATVVLFLSVAALYITGVSR